MDPTLGLCLRVFLFFVFARSLAGKFREPAAFREAVRNYELLPSGWVGLATRALVAAEATVAIALLLPTTHAIGGIGAMALLLLYSGAIAANLARGRRDIGCGCAGPLARSGLHEWLVVRNAFYFLFAAVAALPVAARELGAIDAFTVLVATGTLAALSLATDSLAASAAQIRMDPTR